MEQDKLLKLIQLPVGAVVILFIVLHLIPLILTLIMMLGIIK